MVLNQQSIRNTVIPMDRIDNAMIRARALFSDGVITEAMFRAIHCIWMDAYKTEFFSACDELFIEHIEQRALHAHTMRYNGAAVTIH